MSTREAGVRDTNNEEERRGEEERSVKSGYEPFQMYTSME